MSNPSNFQALVALAMEDPTRARMRPVVGKELLHYDILFALDREGLLDRLTFQGGTSLRLCYGSQRFSEDLDFAGGRDFDANGMLGMKRCLEDHIGERYGLAVTVKEPAQATSDGPTPDIKVHKWQLRIVTSPGRPDLPKQMIKVEVANVPAHTRTPQLLRRNYDFLPDWYHSMPVMVETEAEIMADKLVSLVDCPHLRHRDIWDLQWLQQRGTEVDGTLVGKKLADYSVQDYVDKVDRMIERLPEIIESAEFRDQMARFIPLDVQERTLLKENFLIALRNSTVQLLKQARNAVSHDHNSGHP